jgi:hypothetical protein
MKVSCDNANGYLTNVYFNDVRGRTSSPTCCLDSLILGTKYQIGVVYFMILFCNTLFSLKQKTRLL